MEAEKENPRFEVILAEDSKPGADGASGLPGKLARYSKARHKALQMQSFVANAGHVKEAKKLADCANYLLFRHYYTVDKVRLHAASFCKKHLLCPMCAIRRGAKMLKAYLQRYEAVIAEHPHLRPYLVTVTVKNGPELAERLKHLRKALKRMSEARRSYLSNPKRYRRVEFAASMGGFHSIEVTNKGQGWHPHAHILVLHDTSFDYKRIVKEWKAITGDSCIMNVQAIEGNPDEAFVEVFKYALKFSDLSPEDNVHAYYALKGKRLVFNGGSLRGVKIPESLVDDVPLGNLPYISLFFRYMEGAYKLEREEHYKPNNEVQEDDDEDDFLTPEESVEKERDGLFIKREIYKLKKQDTDLSDQQAYEIARARLSDKKFRQYGLSVKIKDS